MMASDPFARAVESFISDVKSKEDIRSPFYKEVLSGIDSGSLKKDLISNSEECANRLSNFIENMHLKQKRDSKTLWITDKLRPLVTGLSQFTGACDSMFQAAPAAVQVLYGGAKLVLQLAQNMYNCFDTVLSIMEDIGHLLQCYNLFSSSYRSSTDIQNLLVEAYKNIVLFWQKSSQLLNRKVYKTILVGVVKPLDAQWQQFRQRLQKDSTRIQMLAMATEADLRRQKEEKQAKDREINLKRQIIDWIKANEDDCSLDTRRRIQENVEKRHEKTCTWFLDHPTMKQWLNSKETTAVWYSAPPGAGKTILSSTVARKLQDEGLKTVTYFYSFNDNVCRQTITALRCLALQLMIHSTHIPDKVQRLYEEDLTNHCFKLTDIRIAEQVVESLIKQISRVHIIIDGLDECEDESKHFDRFSNLLKAKTLGIVKWLFTSRPTSTIRTHLTGLDVKEIEAPQETLLKDIRHYISDQLTCDTCVDHWTTESDGNFQWISYMLRIMEGDDFTCEEDIDEELKKFPKGLNGCYLRSLAQLSKRHEKHQQLAQRIFTMIVGSAQPLRLSEISHAIAVTPNSYEFSYRRVPKSQLIEQLCSNLVLFDRNSDIETDPTLKFAHKSIHDFFLQDPNSESSDIPKDLRKYFVSEQSAAFELGQSCLGYLNYTRYHLPQDISKIIQDNEHAFLKHAATFWYLYLDSTSHSNDLFRKVEDFIQSPAFWTCVEVQCRTSPYLFARYFRVGLGYNIDYTSSQRDKSEDSFAYAVPLPDWLEIYKPSGNQIVQSFYTFVKDWHQILISEPSAIDQCIMDPVWNKVFPGKADRLTDRLKLFTLCEDRALLSNFSSLSVVNLDFDDGKLFIKLFGNRIVDEECIPEWINLRITSDKVSIDGVSRSNNSLPLETSRKKYGFNRSDTTNRFSLVDTTSLIVQDYVVKEDGELESLSKGLTTPTKGKEAETWTLVHKSTQDILSNRHSRMNGSAFHFNLNTSYQDDHDSQRDSGIGMTVVSDSDSNVSEDSDDDTEETSGDVPTSNSLLFLHNLGDPIQYFWKSTSPAIEVCCAFHPDQNLSLWSPSAHEVCLLDLESGKIFSTILPEPPEIQFATITAMRKEFYFLNSGKSLCYLLYTTTQKNENSIHQTISVSYFDFSLNDDKTISLRRSHSIQSLSYKSFGSISVPLKQSMILTSWSQEYLYIALPPISFNPKIIRLRHTLTTYSSSKISSSPLISSTSPTTSTSLTSPTISTSSTLSRSSSRLPTNDYVRSSFQTLRNPVFFPFTTPDRNPRLTVLHYPKSETSLILSLDAEMSQATDKDTNSFIMRQPPTLMIWPLSSKQNEDWRDWDDAIDEQSEKLRQGNHTYEKLRGSFVASDRRFTVPIRSGLDWTRKAFLSCS
jgi:NACHT domain